MSRMIRWIWIFMLLVLTAHTTRGQGGWYDSVPVSESQTIRQGNATWDESHQWWKLELEEDEHGTGGDYAAYIFAHLSGVRKGRKYHFRYKLRGEAPGSFDAGKLRIVTDENMSQGNLYAYFSVESYPRPNQWMEVSFTATDESFWMMLGAVKKSATTSTTVYIDSISLHELAVSQNAYSNNGYRYGFNGQERDDEIYGRGNSTTAEFWQYDSRLGRRWDTDPVDQINTSNYAVNRNNPIYYNDPNGDCPNCVSAAVGAGVGTLIGGGIEIGMQLHKEGKVSNWKTVRGSALQGGITGGAAGFTGGASLFTTAAVTGGANAVGGVVNRTVQGNQTTVINVATDISIGAVFGAGGKYFGDKAIQIFAKNNLIKELTNNGIKNNANDILEIGKSSAGKIIFLEKGNAKAGLEHILTNHGKEFTQAGISEKDIPQFIMQAVLKGNEVGMQSTRPIYETTYKGVTQKVAVTVGDNGYIVGANMVSK